MTKYYSTLHVWVYYNLLTPQPILILYIQLLVAVCFTQKVLDNISRYTLGLIPIRSSIGLPDIWLLQMRLCIFVIYLSEMGPNDPGLVRFYVIKKEKEKNVCLYRPILKYSQIKKCR